MDRYEQVENALGDHINSLPDLEIMTYTIDQWLDPLVPIPAVGKDKIFM
jgi:hypothetical protein